MRKVEVNHRQYVNPARNDAGVMVPGHYKDNFVQGKFHHWGVSSQEVQDGAMVWTEGLVELPDGTIITAMPHLIRFLEPA